MANVPPSAGESSFWESLSPQAAEFLQSKGVGTVIPDSAAVLEATVVPPTPEPNRRVRRAESASKPPKLTLEKRDRIRLEKNREKVRALTGDAEHVGPRLVPTDVYIMGQDIMSDPTGAAGRIYMRAEPNKILVGAAREAALVPSPHGTRYTWADDRARAILACALMMAMMSVPTRRKGKYTGIVRGIPVGAFAAVIANPFTGHSPSRSAMSGRHRRDGCIENGQVGYLVALREAGVIYSQQLPASARSTQAWEIIGPSGRPTSRHWVLGFIPTAPWDDDEKRRMLAWHAAGWEALTERPQRMPTELRRAQGPPAQAA